MLNMQRIAIAVIVAVVLSLPLISVAEAQAGEVTPSTGTAVKKHVARQKEIYNTAQTPSPISHRIDGETPRADTAYRGYFTLPQEDPVFHGFNGG